MGGLAHGKRRPAAEPEVTAADGAAWRAWLRRHHRTHQAVWLVFFKKGSGTPSVTYGEALEEAICHGWIDGKKRRLDEARYAHRYTPRRADSRWSPRNLEIARAMLAAGRMQAAGKAADQRRREDPPAAGAERERLARRLSPAMERQLRAHPAAWRGLARLAPGQRRMYIAWLNSARRPDTRARRLREAMERLAAGLPLGMK